jgi:hypothetical protein
MIERGNRLCSGSALPHAVWYLMYWVKQSDVPCPKKKTKTDVYPFILCNVKFFISS